jgi:lysozyme family protein
MNVFSPLFLALLEFVFHWEGLKFTGGKNDKGGPTKYGVSLRFLKSIPIEDADLNGDGVVTWQDVYSMRLEQAQGLFHRYFAQPLFVESWPRPLAAVLLDTGVNCGRGSAARWAQAAFNTHRGSFGQNLYALQEDGCFGQKSRAALSMAARTDAGAALITEGIMARRKAHYVRLNATGDPDYTTNFNGWMRRWHSLNAFNAGRPWRMEDKPWEHPQAA